MIDCALKITESGESPVATPPPRVRMFPSAETEWQAVHPLLTPADARKSSGE